MASLDIRNPRSGTACGIELGRGAGHAVEAPAAEELESLLDQLLQLRGAQVAHGVGGMISNISIIENIALPAIFHGLRRFDDFDVQVLEAFAACGMDGASAEALCRKRPGDAGPFERRLAGFVRGLLLRPQLLVYYRFFEGLTRAEMERAAALDAVYRAWAPEGASVYLFLAGMPDLHPAGVRHYST